MPVDPASLLQSAPPDPNAVEGGVAALPAAEAAKAAAEAAKAAEAASAAAAAEAAKPPLDQAQAAVQLRREQARLARERQDGRAELDQLRREQAEWAAAKADPLKLLERGGFDFGKAQEAAIRSARAGQPVAKAEQAAQQARDDITKLREELETERLGLKVEKIKGEIKAFVQADERFDLVSSFSSGRADYTGVDLVCDVLAEHYRATGEELTYEEAALKTEEWLEANHLPQLLKSKKLLAHFEKSRKPATPDPGKKQPLDGPAVLRGADTAAHSPPNGVEEREDRVRRIAQRLESVA